MEKRAVTVIPATIDRFSLKELSIPEKKRVCAYARVSTDSAEQQTSYQAQVNFYTHYIKSNLDWKFINVYTDEGISAVSTKNRIGFKQMIKDALAGKIDLIVTKSVSRFARNTVDSLTTVRRLKEKGVEVYFEKENIYTLDSKGELLITIMSSLAQEESRSISENVTWGQRKRFADGKVTMPYKRFLGYEKGEDGEPRIVETEAKTIRSIYKQFLEGKTISLIAKKLTSLRIPTPSNKTNWSTSTVTSILKNEKYKGDAILQKSFTVDFLTKRTKKNEGEVTQYYVEHSHPAIVSEEVYELVQLEFANRKENSRNYSSNSVFSNKIICAECGSFYGAKVWHSNSKYKRTIWQCNNKYKGKKCNTPHVYEDEIKKAFVEEFSKMIGNKDRILDDLENILKKLFDNYEVESLLYNTNRLEEQQAYISKLRGMDALLDEFDELIFGLTVDKVEINQNERIHFLYIESNN